jgi:hypothetical protein
MGNQDLMEELLQALADGVGSPVACVHRGRFPFARWSRLVPDAAASIAIEVMEERQGRPPTSSRAAERLRERATHGTRDDTGRTIHGQLHVNGGITNG